MAAVENGVTWLSSSRMMRRQIKSATWFSRRERVTFYFAASAHPLGSGTVRARLRQVLSTLNCGELTAFCRPVLILSLEKVPVLLAEGGVNCFNGRGASRSGGKGCGSLL